MGSIDTAKWIFSSLKKVLETREEALARGGKAYILLLPSVALFFLFPV
jgi:hypothetical protein